MPKSKPKLNFLIVCETAFPSQEGNLNIIGIFENVFAPNFPAIHPKMTIVFNVSGNIGEYAFDLSIKGPDKKEIIPSVRGGFNIAGQNTKFGFIGNLVNLKFTTEGTYSVDLSINDRLIGRTQFRVAKLFSR